MRFIFFPVILLFLFSAFAQNQGETSVSGDASKGQMSLNEVDGDLLIEDDQDILPSAKKDSAVTVKSAKTSDSTDISNKTVKVIESDEELILDDEEEYLIAPKEVQKENKDPNITNASVHEKAFSDSGSAVINENAIDSGTQNAVPVVLPKPEQVIISAQPTKIEHTRSINFAQNLKQYRSPKLAMLYSFLFPGAGQIYARHKVKAGVFAAVEAAIISTGVGFAVKGKKEMKKANDFANEHYSVDLFRVYHDSIFKPSVSDTIYSSVFTDISAQKFMNAARNREDLFYDNIQDNALPFVRGWKDVTPKFLPGFVLDDDGYKNKDSSEAFLVYPVNGDTSKAKFGFSKFQEQYAKQYSDANNFYDISQKVLFLLVLDRIISAVDAGITAKAYNDDMLGKQSLWQKVNIKEKQVRTGSDTYNGYALEVRF